MSKTEDQPQPATSPERDAYDWAVRFASGEAGRADIDALKQWAARDPANAAAFDRASAAWHTVGLAAPEGNAGSVRSAAARAGVTSRRLFIGGALAASAAAVVVARPLDLWPSFAELAADYRTAIGERRQIKVFDDVAIDMNTRTSIAMLSAQPGAERIELVSGEALVSRPAMTHAPLTVVAASGRVIAQDARFNVRRDAETVCVTCLDGDAVIEHAAGRQSLAAGQQITYSERGFGAASAADTAAVTAWQGGLLIFRAMPVAEVVAEVNRYRPGKVILTNAALGRERFSARFRIEKVDQVVYQIEQVFHARATALPGGIVLLG